jgi:hypothetical protein
MLSGVAALLATATAMRGRQIRARELVVGPLHAERGIAIVGIGALAVIASAPFDDYWHRTFGRDVDMWSPPHIFAIYGGGILIYVGWTIAAATNVFGLAPRVRDGLVVFFASGVVSTVIFGMNFYYMMGWSREAFFYPLAVCAAVPFGLAIASDASRALSPPISCARARGTRSRSARRSPSSSSRPRGRASCSSLRPRRRPDRSPDRRAISCSRTSSGPRRGRGCPPGRSVPRLSGRSPPPRRGSSAAPSRASQPELRRRPRLRRDPRGHRRLRRRRA